MHSQLLKREQKQPWNHIPSTVDRSTNQINDFHMRFYFDFTYKTPEHRVHTNEPMVMLTYVGPRWSQSKHCLFPFVDTISRRIFRFLSSCFFRTTAILVQSLTACVNYVVAIKSFLLSFRLFKPNTIQKIKKHKFLWLLILSLSPSSDLSC